MADQLSLRGGTTTEHGSFTGANKEVTVDTTKKTLVVHDGATAGGHPIMRENGSNSALALGSAGTPSLKFSGDANTGIYSPGADQVAISTGGTGRLFVDASGNVGVGNSSPGSLLTVRSASSPTISVENNTSTGFGAVLFRNGGTNYGLQSRINLKALITDTATGASALTFETSTGDLAAPTERMRLDSSGRLLVGTSSASSIGPVGTAGFQIETVSSLASISLFTNASNTGGGYLTLGKSRGTAIGSNTIVADGDELGGIYFAGADGTDRATAGASIIARVDGTPGANDLPSRLVFSTTADGASSPTERMRINSSGFISLGGDTDTGFSNPSADTLAFTTGNNERARIDSSGRLLVGTSSAISTSNGAGTATSSAFQIAGGSSTDNCSASISAFSTVSGRNPELSFAKSANNTVGSHSVVAADTDLGEVSFAGSDGSKFVPAASILAEVDGTPGANNMPGRLVFSTTADGAASPTERMRITSNGTVSVGSTASSSNAKLLVNGGIAEFNDRVLTINKSINGSATAQTVLTLTVPADTAAYLIEATYVSSRAGTGTNVGQSRVAKESYFISRNGSGSDVVLTSNLNSADYEVLTTTAGGSFTPDAISAAIARSGAEANTDPQSVAITATIGDVGNSNGFLVARFTIIQLGATPTVV